MHHLYFCKKFYNLNTADLFITKWFKQIYSNFLFWNYLYYFIISGYFVI